MKQTDPPSLSYLFRKFLKIGTISFGGFMALISIVQKELVEKDKTVDNEELPGWSLPGHRTAGTDGRECDRLPGLPVAWIPGGTDQHAGCHVPSFLLVLLLSWIYFSYGNIPEFQKFFDGVLPAVAAIILSVSDPDGEKKHRRCQADADRHRFLLD